MPAPSLLDQLPEAARTALRTAGPAVEVPTGAVLVHDGADDATVFLVVDGLVKVVKSSIDGEVSFIGLRRPGTLVGELGALTAASRSSSVLAVRPSTVVRIDPVRFVELLDEHPAFERALLTELAHLLRAATSQIHDLMNADARTRMAARLVQLLDDTDVEPDGAGHDAVIELPVSQQELGDWAGLSRAGATKALRELREDGLIDTARMAIRVVDPTALRRAATV